MMYTFRNRFRIRANFLDADVTEIRLADSADDGLVALWPVQKDRGSTGGGFIFGFGLVKKGGLISETDELVLQGDGYSDAEHAATAGRKWRQYLTAALARESRAVDFGPDDRVTPSIDFVYEVDPPKMFEGMLKVGDRVIDDDPRLLVFPTEPEAKFLKSMVGTATVRVSGWLERFEQRVKEIRKRDQGHLPWSTEKILAYRLVHLAFTDPNRETRHIQLVTAIEVLLKEQDRPKPILDALDKLRDVIDGWQEDDVKKRIAEILRQNKEESILRAGQEQVAAKLEGTYSDKSPEDFFKHVYNLRSRLVHRARKAEARPTTDDLQKVNSQLVEFVLDALDAYETG
jgi:hypothetical protein